jgi:hypothetical protein
LADDHYAAKNGQTPQSPYTNWTSAALNIQDAVNAATTNDTVWVGAGVYTVPPNATNYIGTNVVFINRPLVLRSSNAVPGDVIIDGQGTNRGVAVYYPYNSTNQIVLDGLTISNCGVISIGGGILFDCPIFSGLAWTGVVQNCRVLNNRVVYGPGTTNAGFYIAEGAYGGGLGSYNRDAFFGLIITNSVFRANVATNAVVDINVSGGTGGGIYCAAKGKCTIAGCQLQNNRAYRGGNAYMDRGIYTTIENSEISGGTAGPVGNQSFGGGIFYANGSVVYRNCLMYGNNGPNSRGAAINNETQWSNTVVELYNCTVVSNFSGGYAIYIRPWARAQNFFPSLHLVNSIVYSNNIDLYLAAGGDGPPDNYSSYATNSCLGSTNSASIMFGATNLLYYKGYSSGTITNDPRFVDFAGNNFRLSRDSPCVNKGFSQPWMTNAVDLDGAKRLRYYTVDMGAYELIFDGTVYRFR